MNQTTCGLIRSCLTQDIKYHVLHETSAGSCLADVRDPGEKASDEEHRVTVSVEEKALPFQDEERTLH